MLVTLQTMRLLSVVGLWLVVATAFMLILTTLVIARIAPRLTLPLMAISWASGTLGFLAVCIADPSLINIALGVLFILSSVYHGIRIINRAREQIHAQHDDDAVNL